MARDWKKFGNDEIYAMWQSYITSESIDPLGRDWRQTQTPTLRLTCKELHTLIEELLIRLAAKEHIDMAL